MAAKSLSIAPLINALRDGNKLDAHAAIKGLLDFCFKTIGNDFNARDSFDELKSAGGLQMLFSGELSRLPKGSFKSDSDSKESWDDRLYSVKSGVLNFSNFFEYRIDRIDRTYRTVSVSIVSIEGRHMEPR